MEFLSSFWIICRGGTSLNSSEVSLGSATRLRNTENTWLIIVKNEVIGALNHRKVLHLCKQRILEGCLGMLFTFYTKGKVKYRFPRTRAIQRGIKTFSASWKKIGKKGISHSFLWITPVHENSLGVWLQSMWKTLGIKCLLISLWNGRTPWAFTQSVCNSISSSEWTGMDFWHHLSYKDKLVLSSTTTLLWESWPISLRKVRR